MTRLRTDIESIERATRTAIYQNVFNEGNIEKLADLYTDDGMRMPPDRPMVRGREAILRELTQASVNGIVKVTLSTIGGAADDELAWGHGQYTFKDGDGKTLQSGKWVHIARLTAGKWRTECDIWNPDAPPTAPATG